MTGIRKCVRIGVIWMDLALGGSGLMMTVCTHSIREMTLRWHLYRPLSRN